MDNSLTEVNVLIDRIKKGVLPEASFSSLLKIYQEQWYWQIRRIVKSHSNAQDVYQLVCIKIWKGIPKFKGDSQFATWAYRICYNEAITYLKKEEKHHRGHDEPLLIHVASKGSSKDYSSWEIEEILYRAINTLPDKQKLVFEYRYFDELSFKEISNITGLSIGGLKANYHHAQKKIEEFLKRY